MAKFFEPSLYDELFRPTSGFVPIPANTLGMVIFLDEDPINGLQVDQISRPTEEEFSKWCDDLGLRSDKMIYMIEGLPSYVAILILEKQKLRPEYFKQS